MSSELPDKCCKTGEACEAPACVIAIAVSTFFALLLLGLLAVVVGPFHRWIAVHPLGRMPAGIVWFAAIGGSLASLTGIFLHHKNDWKDSYNLWHMLRPWTGVVMGVIGAFLLLVSTEIATMSPNGVATTPKPINPDIFYAAAFIAGFAEQSFRELVKRLTQTLFGPGKEPAAHKH